MIRKQFTFYDSFLNAIELMPKNQQLVMYQAIVRYALLGKKPEFTTALQESVFAAIRPHLDSGRRKAQRRLEKMREAGVEEKTQWEAQWEEEVKE